MPSMYAGPGENYRNLGNVNPDDLTVFISEENGWLEVEYQNRRAYVRKGLLKEIDTRELPLVSTTMVYGPSLRPSVYHFSNVFLDLTCATPVKGKPTSSASTIDTLSIGDSVEILCQINSDSAIGNINPFVLIQYETDNGLMRGYAQKNTLLDVNNPLRGFQAVKESNASFTYDGHTFYSTVSSVSSMDGWSNYYSETIEDRQFDWLQAIAGAIASNDSDIDLQGELWLYDQKKYRNVPVNTQKNGNMQDMVDTGMDVLGMIMAGIENGSDVLSIHVDLETYQSEGRMIIRGGQPFESVRAGKKISLAELIVEGEPTALFNADRRADEMIRSICPDITGSDLCSMEITVSRDFSDNPYGYYFAVARDGTVYRQVIVHPGTEIKIYQSGKLLYDIAPRLASVQMKLSDDDASRMLQLLRDNGIAIDTP